MPAMSPTMTEGNLTKWKIKEGESYSAGDVLLDIETDKAQMDVEAQEDGILARIIQGDGTKSIKVGSRIAVVAEPGDDLASLEMPPDKEPAAETSRSQSEQSSQDATGSQKSDRQESAQAKQSSPPPSDTAHAASKYPLYPSVQALLIENGLQIEDAAKIPASGPSGRLLKGDVLSYLGQIKKDYSAEQSARISKLGHLDFSNIQKATPKPTTRPPPPPKTESVPEPAADTQVAVPISLVAVLSSQKRIKDTLGITLPLSTFIARASEIANERLPRAQPVAPDADELFDAVLGLDKVKKTSRGTYVPQIAGLPSDHESSTASTTARHRPKDVIDLLTSGPGRAALSRPAARAADTPASGGNNVFSVTVKKGEENRARTYLERVKTVLEAEPGSLVL